MLLLTDAGVKDSAHAAALASVPYVPPHYVPKVYIQGPHNLDYLKLFIGLGLQGVDSIKKADIVCFTGGADVSAKLYGEQELATTGSDWERDKADCDAFEAAKDKFKVGICRGGQFLNVMNGGSLWQDVNNHCGDHLIVDKKTKARVFPASSTHHQMMRPGPHVTVVATADICTRKKAEKDSWDRYRKNPKKPGDMKDLEVCWYRRSTSLCFQPHPEFQAYVQCREYFYQVMKRYCEILNPKKGVN